VPKQDLDQQIWLNQATNVEVDVQLDGGPRANPSEVAIVANQSTAVRSTGLDSAEPLKGLHAHARTFPFS